MEDKQEDSTDELLGLNLGGEEGGVELSHVSCEEESHQVDSPTAPLLPRVDTTTDLLLSSTERLLGQEMVGFSAASSNLLLIQNSVDSPTLSRPAAVDTSADLLLPSPEHLFGQETVSSSAVSSDLLLLQNSIDSTTLQQPVQAVVDTSPDLLLSSPGRLFGPETVSSSADSSNLILLQNCVDSPTFPHPAESPVNASTDLLLSSPEHLLGQETVGSSATSSNLLLPQCSVDSSTDLLLRSNPDLLAAGQPVDDVTDPVNQTVDASADLLLIDQPNQNNDLLHEEVLQKTEQLHKTDLPDLPKKGDLEGHQRNEVEAPPEQQDVASTGVVVGKVTADYRLQFNPIEGALESVPEHDLLTKVEPLVQVQNPPTLPESKESDATSETQSESNSTAVSSRTGGYSQFTKTEPLTAKQQVALWLTRTSTQDLNQEFSVNSLRSLVLPASAKQKKSKMAGERKSEIRRNFSTKSLMEKFTPSKDPSYIYSPIRKCETVLALSEGRDPHYSRGFETLTPMNSACHLHHHHNQKKRRSRGCSNSSIFKRFSKTGSDVFNRPLTHGRTAPGELGGTETPNSSIVAVRPVNRLRSQSSLLQCSRCTSVLSVNCSRTTSQMSLLLDRKSARLPSMEDMLCKICLVDYSPVMMVKLDDCGCSFCKECMSQYITFEVMEGAYDISCPDQDCPAQGVLNQHQMERLTSKELMDKHRTFRLNTEVSMDAARTFCPSAGCDTICHICVGTKSQGVPVSCPTCDKEFCSLCSATWHPALSCSENGALLMARGAGEEGGVWDPGNDTIKKCPMCHVPIERDAGCAQMMCKRCKHVFCWYCLTSLDDDFLLRHYDSGACKGKLGHSRASVLWHRAQVIGIFAGFGILLLVASPLLLVAAPCVICCKCRSCTKPGEIGSDKSESTISKLSKSPS